MAKKISDSWVNTTITSLNLWNNYIGPAEAAYFLNCPALETLELSNNPLGDEGADLLSRIPTLTELDLTNVPNQFERGRLFSKQQPVEVT